MLGAFEIAWPEPAARALTSGARAGECWHGPTIGTRSARHGAAATVVVVRGAMAIRRNGWLAVGLATLTMVSGCELKLKMLLFNNTSNPVTVHLWKRTVVIAPGKSARFNYPEPKTLRISTAGCNVSYAVPSTLQHPPWPPPGHRSPLKVQLEPDLAIFLLPWQTKSIENVTSFGSMQLDGFPLQPTSRSCP